MSRIIGRLALVVGHDRLSPGAFGVHPINAAEYEYNSDLAAMVERFGKRRGHDVQTFFRDGVGIAGAYAQASDWEPDAVIELHFNAFNGVVTGTETLFSDADDEKGVMEREFATAVQQAMCRVLSRTAQQDRGVKDRPLSRGERGFRNVNQMFWIPSILIEPFFGDSRSDARLAVERKSELAEALIHAFEYWRAQVGAARGYISAAAAMTASTPDTSDTPDTPDAPDTPDSPDTPDTPEAPDTPDSPRTVRSARKPRRAPSRARRR